MKKKVPIIITLLVILSCLGTIGSVSGEEPQDTQQDAPLFINLKAARFDPMKEESAIAQELKFTKENEYYLVQCKGPIQPHWVETILNSNAQILGYIPQYTYIIHMEKEGKKSMESLPFIRWTGIYHPAYKIDESIMSKEGQIQLNLMVFENVMDSQNLNPIKDKIQSLGGYIFGEEDRIIRVSIDASKIVNLAFIPQVEWLDEYSPPKSLMDNIRVFTGAESPLFEYGFDGTGIVGEVKDNGIDQNHPEFEGQLIATDGSVSEESHGTSTFGIVFAKGETPRAMGMMPGAEGVFCDWGVGRKQSIENLVSNWDGVFQSNSWSTGSSDSTYTSVSQQNDDAIFEFDVTMLYASGNGGNDETITRDGTAKNVITVGAPNHYDNQDRTDDLHNGNQGNKGPTADGRIKPDIVGPYDSIYTTTSGGGYTSGFGGTSGATPIVAGGVGLIYEMYRENHFGNNPSNDLPHAATVKAILIADAYHYEFSQGDRFAQGWGLVDVGNTYFIGENHLIDDETISLETGESTSYNVQPTGMHQLKITLVWTDVPGTTSASQHLINDLNLKVTDPNGEIYYGNVGLETSKWSSTGGAQDTVNNVENVFIEIPVSGEWTIEVIAENIAMDGNVDTTEIDQPFALVASGVKTSDFDMAITNMEDLPRYLKLNQETVVNGTISNIGFQDKSNVVVNLLEDGVVVDTKTLSNLQSGNTQSISLSWVPTTEKTSEITIEAAPVSGEERLDNNQKKTSVDLFTPIGFVLIDRGHGNYESLGAFYEHLYSLKFPVTHLDVTITSGSIAGYNILITARATTDYTPSELAVIEDFVKSGGGLFVIGDDNSAIYDDLTGYAGITWTTPRGIGGDLTDINEHEITEDVEELHLASPNLVLEISPPAQEIVYDNDIVMVRPLVAVSTYETGRIVALADDNCLDDGNLDSSDNRKFGENVIKWLNSNLGPIAIIDSPIDGGNYSSTDSIEFNASSSYDPDGYISEYTWTSDIDGSIGTGAIVFGQLGSGEHVISLVITDNGGFTSNTTITITVTTPIPPTIEIESPNSGETVNNIQTISGTAADIDGTVELVQIRIGNGDWTNVTGTVNWEYEWDTTFISDGDWTIYARSVDDEGFFSDTSSITISVDNTPPNIIFGPNADDITDTTATIEWKTDEPGDCIVEYGTDTDYGFVKIQSLLVTRHSLELVGLDPSTTYHFRVKTKDAVGNTQVDIVDRTFTTDAPPDTTPPTAQIRSPENGDSLKDEVQIMVDASDDYDVDRVKFFISGKLKFTDSDPNYSWIWDTADGHYPDGDYTIKIVAIDTSGNEASHEITVTLDNEIIPPFIVKTRVSPNSFESGESLELLFTVKVEDPENAITSIELDLSSIDGSSNQKMYDDGSHGDEDADDNVYSYEFTVPSEIGAGDKYIGITISYARGGSIDSSVTLYVIPATETGDGDDKTQKEDLDMMWLLAIALIAILSTALVAAVALKRRQSGNEVVVVPTYQPVYYKEQPNYYKSQYYRNP